MMRSVFYIYKFKLMNKGSDIMIPTILASSGSYTQAPGLLDNLEKKTVFSDIPRGIGWDALKSCCKILDGVFDAFNKLLNMNFYEIPGIKNFVSKTTPIAWLAFGVAIIIGAIVLAINKDKLKISEFFKSILVSAALIVAMPFALGVFNDMKNAGTSDMQKELKQNKTMGQTILASVTVDIEKSSENRRISTLMDSNKNAYSLNVTDTLDKDDWKYEVKTKQLDITYQNEESDSYVRAIKSFFEISSEQYSAYMALSADQKTVYFKANMQQRLANLKNNDQILQCNTLEEACAFSDSTHLETGRLIKFSSRFFSSRRIEFPALE